MCFVWGSRLALPLFMAALPPFMAAQMEPETGGLVCVLFGGKSGQVMICYQKGERTEDIRYAYD